MDLLKTEITHLKKDIRVLKGKLENAEIVSIKEQNDRMNWLRKAFAYKN